MHEEPRMGESGRCCPVCAAGDSDFLFSKDSDGRGDGPIALRLCRGCKTVFLECWESKSHPELYSYYAQRISIDKVNLYDPIVDSRYLRLLAEFRAACAGRKLLDVGCGQGHFVDVALREGWDATGIEQSEAAVRVCHKFGLPVRQVDFLSIDTVSERYDVITMFEVIEHLPIPRRFIERAEELLQPGGIFYLTTPNFACLDRKLVGSDWDVIHREHILYFTPQTLRRLITGCTRLEIDYIYTRNFSPAILWHLFSRQPNNRGHSGRSIDRDVRTVVEASRILRGAKSVANKLVRLLGCGSTLVARLRKP